MGALSSRWLRTPTGTERWRDHARAWAYALGAALVLLGVLALLETFAATVISVMVFAWLLLLSGAAQIVHVFLQRGSDGLVVHLIGGVIAVGAGILLLINPLIGAAALTLLLGFYFLASGAFRLVWAGMMRFPGWGWYLPSGIITILLGALILAQWPASGAWVIGLFIAIDLLLLGSGIIAIAAAAPRLRGKADPPARRQ